MSRFRYRGIVQDYEGRALDGAQVSVYLQGPRHVTATTGTSGTLNGTYYYTVQLRRGGDWSYYSSEVSATTDGGATAGSVTISWQPEPGVEAFRVWRGTASGTYDEYVDVGGDTSSFTDDGSVSWTSGTPEVSGAKVYTDEFSTTPTTALPQLTTSGGGFYEFWVDTDDYDYHARFRIEAVYGSSKFVEDDVVIYPLAEDAFRLGGHDPFYYIYSHYIGSLFDKYYEELSYDAAGNVVRVDIYTDSSKAKQIGYMELSYDAAGNVNQVVASFGGRTMTMSIGYDASGNPVTVETTLS